MAQRMLVLANTWKVVIELVVGICGFITIAFAVGGWTEKQEQINFLQNKSIYHLETRELKRDSILTDLSAGQKQTLRLISSMQERWDAFEPEHIQLMKLHSIYPQKLYRGEAK